MKKLTTETKRILAAIGGAAIVLALLLAVDGITGDPLSRALARRSAVAYAEKLYPGQTFVPDGETICSQPFFYITRVQSEQSPDTWFPVRTGAWLFTGDTGLGSDLPGHVFYVEQKRNTCWRMEREAGKQLEALAQKQYGDACAAYNDSQYRPFVFMLCCDAPQETASGLDACTQDVEKWGSGLELDAPFTPAVLQKTPALLTACRICPSGAVTAAEKEQALRELKAFVESVGWRVEYYQVRFLCQNEETGTLTEFAVSDIVPAGDTGDIKALSQP